MTEDAAYTRVFANNKAWVRERLGEDPSFFEDMAAGQEPDFLYIGCADSRVPANVIMGVQPGEVFVHRNVANLVVNTDLNAQSCIDYAVTILGVRHIVVCGHYGCGGVGAAMRSEDLGLLNLWLREIRDVYRWHREELDAIADQTDRYRRLVELNVREQVHNVIKTACVQRSFRRTGFPQVYGWAYDHGTGLLKDLEIPFEEVLDRVSSIYRLD